MATPLIRWFLLALLFVPLGALAQDKQEKPDKKYPTADDIDDSKEPTHHKERARGSPDPCKLSCAQATASCVQSCNPQNPSEDDPELKDAKKITKRKPGESEKCVRKCSQTHGKCLAACK